MEDYGKELILDLHNCDASRFTRDGIGDYLKRICALIDMERGKLTWWDDLYFLKKEKETEPHLVGTSAVQFIKTSNITIHTLDIMRRVYLNVFSCKDFDEKIVVRATLRRFGGTVVNEQVVRRV